MTSEAQVPAVRPRLSVEGLEVEYRNGLRGKVNRAVKGIDLVVYPGETVGLVGESGSGKSTLGRAILGLTPASAGTVRLDGEDITHATAKRRLELSSVLQVVFQDPYSSLNPTRTIGQSVAEPLGSRRRGDHEQVRTQVRQALERVGLPADAARRYPAQFSGGQRQRIAIARAIVCSPRLIVCDEPVSGLDLSVQAQVLNLLSDLQRDADLSLLFIAHDLDVVHHVSNRIAVMCEGSIVESGLAGDVYSHPQHAFTKALLAAAPTPDPHMQRERRRQRRDIAGATQTTSAVPRSEAFPEVKEAPSGLGRPYATQDSSPLASKGPKR